MNYKTVYKYIILITVWLQHYIEDVKADCVGALGMESGEIKDSQIKASKWLYGGTHYAPAYARLNVKSSSGSWCSADIHEYKDQYIQIDLLKNTKLTAIATQGRHHSVEYIEKFQIKYQRDNEDFFRNYEEIQGTWKMFTGNKDNQQIVKNIFIHPIIARTIRIYPRGEEYSIYCTRLELYGCKWRHEQSAVVKYSAPYGTERKGVNLRDTTYDGNWNSTVVYNGLGKLTDDIYGGKDILLDAETGSPWVAYNTQNPEIKFEFQRKKVIKQIMVYVNNNNKDMKIFSKVDVFISPDNIQYKRVKVYVTNEKQRQKIDAFPVVIDLGEVVTKYLKFQFTKQQSNDLLVLSEVVFLSDRYPPSVVPTPSTPDTKDTNSNNNNNKPVFTLSPDLTLNENQETDNESESKGLSFPIILTIALVTIVLAVVFAVVIYKSYRKNRKQDSVRCNVPAQAQLITTTGEPKQDVEARLLYEDRIMAMHHPNQPPTIIPQNGMYMQPVIQGNSMYNTQVMMS